MSRLETTNSYHHGDLRNAILRAATELLEEKGAPALSLREVARRAGVSPAAPYHHFKDKAALIGAVAATSLMTLDRLSERAIQAETVPQRKLEALGVAYVIYAAEHPTLFSLIFGAARPPLQETDLANAPVYRVLTRVIDEFDLHEGQKDVATISAWSLVHGLAALVVEGPLRRLASQHEEVRRLAVAVTSQLRLG